MLDEEDLKLRQTAARGKYGRLFISFVDRWDYRWRATFDDIEEILGFALPPSARRHSAWWSNTKSHSHALAWLAAGWKVSEVDMEAEMLVFEGPKFEPMPWEKRGKINLDEFWPVHHAKLLQKDATFSREEIYEDRI